MLTVLYTQNLRGDFDLLPRLYTFIRTLRGKQDGRTLLVDLGGSCAPEVWHCAVTGGRSTLIALDGMGYDLAHVALDAPNRARLADQVTLQLVEDDHYTDSDSGIRIRLESTDETTLADGVLTLQTVAKGQVGQVTLDPPDIISAHIHDLPADTLPDATIAGVIDFITGEARYYQKKQNENQDNRSR